MKRIFSVGLIFAMFFCCCCSVNAKSIVSVSADDVEIKNNRLFDIEICVDTDIDLATAKFEITYDNSIMEYRNVSTSIADGMVKAVDKAGKVTAIFLKDTGIGNGKDIRLFSVKFKSIDSGCSNVNLSVSESVDNTAKELNYVAHNKCKVTVEGNSLISKNSGYTKSNKSSKSEGEFVDEYETKRENEEAFEKGNGEEDLISLITDNTNNRDFYLLIIMILVLIIIVGGALFVKRLNSIENKLNKVKEENSEHSN